MKRILVLVLALLSAGCVLGQEQAKNKIAVYVTGGKTNADNKVIGQKLVSAITKSQDFSAVERTETFLSQISKEQSYQRSGSVDDKQIAKLGIQEGVNYVCVAEITALSTGDFITARLIDVKTASVTATADGNKQIKDLTTLISVSDELASDLLKNAAQNKNNQGKQRVAVYITGESNNDITKVLGAKLVSAITSSKKYVAMERTQAFLNELTKELSYQQSGSVNENQLAALGKQFGVQYVCVADVMTSYGSNFLATRLINVETGLIIATSEEALASEDISSIVTLTNKIANTLLYNAGADDRAREAREKAEKEAEQDKLFTKVNGGIKYNGLIWADKNVGANSQADYGGDFTWKEAQKICPAGWRLPTKDEFQQLVNAGSEWTTKDGHNGRNFGGYENNAIFLPAAGFFSYNYNNKLYDVGSEGRYWSSTGNRDSSYILFFTNDNVSPDKQSNHTPGYSVRCVKDE